MLGRIYTQLRAALQSPTRSLSVARRTPAIKRTRSFRLGMEALEDRTVPAGGLNGAIYTSLIDGGTVNHNIYDSKEAVYLNGGPQNLNGPGLPDGVYVFQVTNPSGSTLLSDDTYTHRELQVIGGVVSGHIAPGDHADGNFNPANGSTSVQLFPFDNTNNHGGEYKVWLTPLSQFNVAHQDAKHNFGFDGDQKTDNFKVRDVTPGVATVTTVIDRMVGTGNNVVELENQDSGPLGSYIHDFASVTGTNGTPTGSVTFNFYTNGTGAGNPLHTVTVPLVGGEAETSPDDLLQGAEGPLAAGDYSFVATYTPDAAGIAKGYSLTVGDVETFHTGQGDLGFSTTILDAGGGAVTNALGESVKDSSSFTGVNPNFAPTGTVSYQFFQGVAYHGPVNIDIYANHSTNDGGGAPYSNLVGSFQSSDIQFGYDWHPFGLDVFGADVTGRFCVSGDATYTFTLGSDDGSLLFIDGNLVVDRGGPNSPGDTSGSTALTAGDHTFEIQYYEDFGAPGGLNLTVPGTVVAAGTVPVVNGVPGNSNVEGPLHAGTYGFMASFTSGDNNYSSVIAECEPLTINQAQLYITTEIFDESGGAVTNALGEKVYDTATVTGTFAGFDTGAITFTFDGNDATQASGGTQSVTEGPLHAGTHHFNATVAGNSDYFGAISDDEPLTINQADTSTSTQVHNSSHTDITGQWVAASTIVHDNATVTSSNNSFTIDGTVTYTFYSGVPNTGSLVSTEPLAVGIESTPQGPLAAGAYYYIATYGGNNDYKGSTGDPEPFRINAKPVAVNDLIDCVNVGQIENVAAPGVLANDSDPDNGPNPLTAVKDSDPAHGALTFNSNGSFSYTPNDAYFIALGNTGSHPTDSFTYHATDGVDNSNTATVTLTINRAPVAVTDSISMLMNVPKTGNVLTNDKDPDAASAVADGATVTAVNGLAANVGTTINLGSGSTLLINADGSFTYTPGPDFHGTQSFSYTITDHCGLSSTVTDTITVTSGALTQGYWKTHQSAFDAVLAAHPNVAGFTSGGKLLIAGVGYTSTEAINLMNMSTGTGTSANAILSLWQQLVAAKLNVLNGVTPASFDTAAIIGADAALDTAAHQILGVNYTLARSKIVGSKKGTSVYSDAAASGAFISVSSTLGQQMVGFVVTLTNFNQTGS